MYYNNQAIFGLIFVLPKSLVRIPHYNNQVFFLVIVVFFKSILPGERSKFSVREY
jgi:hypothetical protein